MSVSTLIQKMITRAKAQKLEQAVNHWERYKQILKEASAGEQPDAAELDAVLAELGKKYEDMAPDAEHIVNREQWAADAAKIPSHQAAMDAAQARLDAVIAEQKRIMADYNTKSSELYRQVREHEQHLLIATSHRDKLSSTCADPSIKAREAELHRLGVELIPEQREVQDRIRQCDVHINHCQRWIDDHESKIEKFPNSPGFIREQREKLTAKQVELQSHQRQRDVEQAELDGILRQLREIHAEQAELAKRKLIP